MKKSDIFFDVGANVGYLSLLAAHCLGSTGHVYAFEPLPENYSKIQNLILQNKIHNLSLIPAAVSQVSGKATLFLASDKGIATPSLLRGRREFALEVSTLTLDEFIRENPIPNLVKIDVEGAEEIVLLGATQLLQHESPPVWLIEIHNSNIDFRVRQLLHSYKYQIQPIKSSLPQPKEYPLHIIATRD